MANIPITHATLKTDYSGSGTVPANAELVAADWNQTHFTLSAGTGIGITSDGNTPPTLTFTATSVGLGTVVGVTNVLPLYTGSNTLGLSLLAQPITSQVSAGGTFLPSADNAYDLGIPNFRWRSGAFASGISVGTVAQFFVDGSNNLFIIAPTKQLQIGGDQLGTTGLNQNILIGPPVGASNIVVPRNNNFDLGTAGSNTPGVIRTWGSASTISAGGGLQTNAITPALNFGSAQAKIRVAGVNLLQFDTGTMFPVTDNGVALGGSNNRYSNLILAGGLTVGFAAGVGAPLTGIINAAASVSAATGFQTNDTTTGVTTPLLFYATALRVALNGQSMDWLGGGSPAFVGARPMLRWDSSGNLVINSNNSASADLYLNFDSNRNTIFGGLAGNNVRPQTDNAVDLGIPANRWRNAQFAGSTSIGTLQLNALNSPNVNGVINADGAFVSAVGSQTTKTLTSFAQIYWNSAWHINSPSTGTIFLDQNGGSTNIQMVNGGHWRPGTDNAQDLGDGPNSLRWRHGYFSGIVSAGLGLVVPSGGVPVPGEGGTTAIFLQNNSRIYSVGSTSAFQMVDANPGKTIDWLFGLRSDLGPAADFTIYRNVGTGTKVWTNVAMSAGTSHQTNNNPALAVGGLAVDTGVGRAQVANLYIAVQVNGVTRYIPLFT